MNKKLTGKKILSSLLVLVLTLATVIGTNQLVKAEEGGLQPCEFIILINAGWDKDVKVEYKVNDNDYRNLSEKNDDPQFNQFSIEKELSKSDQNTLWIRITASKNKIFADAQALTKSWDGSSFILGDADVSKTDTNGNQIFEYSIEVNKNQNDKQIFFIGLRYCNSGRAEIVNEAKRYIYAYNGTKDFDKSGTPNEDDLKHALASELYDRFFAIDMFGDFGINSGETSDKINQLAKRIAISDKSGSVDATTSSSETKSIDTYTATVDWGLDEENGSKLTSTLTVYALPDDKSLLIGTGFDYSTGKANKYYVRDISNDITNFTDSNIDPSSDPSMIITESNLDVNKVAIGGHGAVTDIIDSTNNYITMLVETRDDRQNLRNSEDRLSCQVRVLNPSKNFVAIHARGETEAVDGLTPNGFHPDTIYEAGNNSDKLTARIFIGDTTVNIGSLCPNTTGLSDDSIKITNVELANSKMKDGVTITKNTNSANDWWTNSWDVSFKSNFYDSVPLILTYNDSSAKYITLQRIGLVVRYKYLFDPFSDGITQDNIIYDCYGNEKGPSFTYNYNGGEQIMIYATYYHPSNDPTGGNSNLNLIVKYGNGEKKVISSRDTAHSFNGYHSGANGAVATTTFLIDFIPAKKKDQEGNWSTPITSTNYNGGLHALVVNGGFNDKNSFGGAQIGNGLGVYWDGNITWDF